MSGAKPANKAKMKGILTDVTKCIGCERCVEACANVNDLPVDLPTKHHRKDGLSGRRLTSILPLHNGEVKARKQCLHCLDPACVSACLVGAFYKREDGPVIYDAHKCIGCRYCMIACPFSIPRYEWSEPMPYVRKCKMNEECRVEGNVPACVAACPTGATIFGEREELIKEAKRRIRDNPRRYMDHVYGEHEFGGTSVLYITGKDQPLTGIGFPTPKELEKRAVSELEKNSIPHMNHRWVMVTPVQFFTVFAGLFGVWVIRRRQKLSGPPDREDTDHTAAGFDEVCETEPSSDDGDKEGE